MLPGFSFTVQLSGGPAYVKVPPMPAKDWPDLKAKFFHFIDTCLSLSQERKRREIERLQREL